MGLSRPTVASGSRNGTSTNSGVVQVAADSGTANTSLLTLLAKDVRTSGALIPAGGDDGNYIDTPVKLMIDDARAEAARLIALSADPTCRCTVAILIERREGDERNLTTERPPTGLSGRRCRCMSDRDSRAAGPQDVAALQAVATTSGGQYFEITKAQILAALASPAQIAWSGSAAAAGTAVTSPLGTAAAAPTGTVIVPEMVKAINTAIQHAFASSGDVNIDPTPTLPFGPQTDFQVTSPIIGTVNLDAGVDINGVTLLPDSANVLDKSSVKIPQRSNLMLTQESRCRDRWQLGAFACIAGGGCHQPSGYKFQSDGTRLWARACPARRAKSPTTRAKPVHRDAGPARSLLHCSERATLAPLMI